MTDLHQLDTAALGLVFILGLRHGLDPDHIAVVDNLTFSASDERPSLAPWIGTLFALGHSLSVAIVATGVSFLSGLVDFPQWIAGVFDWLVSALLVVVGALNLRALRSTHRYRPVGWRQKLVPRALRNSSSPLAALGIGMIFGLVFDTATQAAAWGTAASAGGRFAGALLVALAFAVGMILTDTADSQIIARLLKSRDDPARMVRYRRAVGWLIVSLSFGMAGYSLAAMLRPTLELPDMMFTTLGVAMAFAVIAFLATTRRVGRPA